MNMGYDMMNDSNDMWITETKKNQKVVLIPTAADPASINARISAMHSCSFTCTSFAFSNKGLMFSGVMIIASLGSGKDEDGWP